MPDFNWVNTPPHGTCIGCLAAVNDKGFVNTYAETEVRNDVGHSLGVVDVVFCADCVLQQAKLVGGAMPHETEAFALREFDLMTENEKLKDEVQAWQGRVIGLVGLTEADLGA